jgi:hypothetical protein
VCGGLLGRGGLLQALFSWSANVKEANYLSFWQLIMIASSSISLLVEPKAKAGEPLP